MDHGFRDDAFLPRREHTRLLSHDGKWRVRKSFLFRTLLARNGVCEVLLASDELRCDVRQCIDLRRSIMLQVTSFLFYFVVVDAVVVVRLSALIIDSIISFENK